MYATCENTSIHSGILTDFKNGNFFSFSVNAPERQRHKAFVQKQLRNGAPKTTINFGVKLAKVALRCSRSFFGVFCFLFYSFSLSLKRACCCCFCKI